MLEKRKRIKGTEVKSEKHIVMNWKLKNQEINKENKQI